MISANRTSGPRELGDRRFAFAATWRQTAEFSVSAVLLTVAPLQHGQRPFAAGVVISPSPLHFPRAGHDCISSLDFLSRFLGFGPGMPILLSRSLDVYRAIRRDAAYVEGEDGLSAANFRTDIVCA
jgi:hypothetical protein